MPTSQWWALSMTSRTGILEMTRSLRSTSPSSQAAPQLGWHTVALAVRTSSDSRELLGSLRRAVMGLAPQSAVYDLATLEERVAATIAPQRQRAVVFGLFALVAVILAAVGLSGLLASVVAQ